MTKAPDGRRRPPTGALPPTEPLTASQVRQNAAAKRMLRRLVHGENPPTAPMSIVDRLAGSPYANPMIQVGGVDTSARKTIDFALHLAESMFRYGAGALEVETSIIAITAALGLKHIEVDITNQSVAINYAPKDQTPITLLRVVRSWTNNYAGLAQVHQLVTEIVAGGVGRDEAVRRLDDIVRSSKPFPRWMVTVAFAVFAAVFVGVLGGGLGASAVAFVSNLLVSFLARRLSRWRTPDFFITASCAFLVTFIALLVSRFGSPVGIQIAPEIVVVGGILLLLPTGRLVSSVQDAINGFPVTAAGRFLSTILTFGALVTGIAVGFVVVAKTGMEPIDVTKTFPPAYPWWAIGVFVAIAVVAIGITEQTSWKLLLPTAAVGVIGYLVLIGGRGTGNRAALFAGPGRRHHRLARPGGGTPDGRPAAGGCRPRRTDPVAGTHHIPVHVCIDDRRVGYPAGRRGHAERRGDRSWRCRRDRPGRYLGPSADPQPGQQRTPARPPPLAGHSLRVRISPRPRSAGSVR